MHSVVIMTMERGDLDDHVFDPVRMLDLSPTAITYWDRDLVCRHANRACKDWFGIDPELLLGSRLETTIDLLCLDSHFALMDAALQGERRSVVHAFHDGVARRDGLVHFVPDVRGHFVNGLLIQVSPTPAIPLFVRTNH